MHGFYRERNVRELQRRSFRAESFPQLAMLPKDAYEKLVDNEVDYVPLTQVQGRVSATLALIYPPGIGVVVPGERWDERAQPMLDYFLAFEESFNRFPGFNYEVQGVYQEKADGRIRFHTYVVREYAAIVDRENPMAEQKKKMNVMQLTFIVTVNMMGSGIIMLPANMAQVGAISLLVVGRHRAGVAGDRLRLRAGGTLQPAHRRARRLCGRRVRQGRLLPGLLPVLPVAGDRERGGGELGAGLPGGVLSGMASTPVISCISVIALLWLTTVANFGGPGLTGKLGSITVWGVILPVGFIATAGWVWFSSDTFAAAWNPKGLSLFEGMGSSISLTLWAFLGMESASQNASAVENPKRDVPLACMFGTLGAAIVYILSTTVIQGIVPNAQLAESSGPFGLAFAQMFNPLVGQIVMALAAMACVGSLLGWQFTLATTAKDAADTNMFPRIFGKVTGAGRADRGHGDHGHRAVGDGAVHDLAQPERAVRRAREPGGGDERGAVHHFAVGAVRDDAQRQGGPRCVPAQRHRGDDRAPVLRLCAVRVGQGCGDGRHARDGHRLHHLRLHRAAVRRRAGCRRPVQPSARGPIAKGMTMMDTIGPNPHGRCAVRLRNALIGALLAAALATPALAAGTLDKARDSGKLTLGYRTDTRPFSFNDEAGKPAGYSVTLCQRIADAVKAELKLPALAVEFVPVTAANRFDLLQQGQVDLVCGTATPTLQRRAVVDFSIPIFMTGVGAAVRIDSSQRLREALAGRASTRPVWRGAPGDLTENVVFAAVGGTTIERALIEGLKARRLVVTVAPVPDNTTGIQMVLDGRAAALFGDRPVLLDAAQRGAAAGQLMVIERTFTREPLALALRRGDDAFRLVVDRSLSRLFRSPEMGPLYTRYFGAPDMGTLEFFQSVALPD